MSDFKTYADLRRTSGPAPGWSDRPISTGALSITGAVLGGDADWHVYRDAVGWTNVVLVGRPEEHDPRWRVRLEPVLDEVTEASGDPVTIAELIAARLGPAARGVELGIARIAPHHGLIELLNVSLPALVHWDPTEGMAPYEPLARSLDELPAGASTEVIRLRPGGAVVGVTAGLLPGEASWAELRAFLRASAVDPIGGEVARAAPSELARMLTGEWVTRPGPSAAMVLGLPRADRMVA